MSPTQRTLKYCRDQGGIVAVVEKHIPFPKPFGTKQDLFGFADILHVHENCVDFIQVTSGSNVGKRIKKLRALPAVAQIEENPCCRVLVHGWRKLKGRWTTEPRIEHIWR